MPLKLWWRPNDAPAATDRINIGLELGGDDDRITAPTLGRIRINEIGGSGPGTGTVENTQARLIATFHGTFHREPKAKENERLTFEIFIGNTVVDPHRGEVYGFDPECIIGVDGFVLTFLNREFQINLPFMVDIRSEGTHLEFQASAEADLVQGSTTPLDLGRAVLRMPIRRNHDVETTTRNSPPHPGNKHYTGAVIGNLILHHENYLVRDGVTKPASANWPNVPLDPQIIPIPWTGATSVPFQNYVVGNMNIVLLNDLLDPLVPDPAYLLKNVVGVTDGTAAANQVRARLRDTTRNSLSTIFVDAGFVGANVLWEDEPAASQLVQTFKAAFNHGFQQWSLKNPQNPLATSFWNFFIVGDTNIQSVGVAEMLNVRFGAVRGGIEYLLPCPSPIGSGNKEIKEPVKIRTAYFASRIMKNHASMDDLNIALDAVAGKLAICIAHEIGHSLGLMHDIMIENNGPYSESAGSPVLSIMSSSIDDSSFGLNMQFSGQAKAIWVQAFHVQPNFVAGYLRNKTWTEAEVRTVGWFERNKRFRDRNNENIMPFKNLLTTNTGVPTYAIAPPGAQRGTYKP